MCEFCWEYYSERQIVTLLPTGYGCIQQDGGISLPTGKTDFPSLRACTISYYGRKRSRNLVSHPQRNDIPADAPTDNRS